MLMLASWAAVLAMKRPLSREKSGSALQLTSDRSPSKKLDLPSRL